MQELGAPQEDDTLIRSKKVSMGEPEVSCKTTTVPWQKREENVAKSCNIGKKRAKKLPNAYFEKETHTLKNI